MPQAYITTVLLWTTDTDVTPVPVMGIHDSADAAQANAIRVVAELVGAVRPELLGGKVHVIPFALPDAGVRDFLQELAQQRPDLAQHAAVPRTPRGTP